MTERTYTEKEITALLQRSAELQVEEAGRDRNAPSGLTLSELEAVVNESGLDSTFLHRAAQELELSGGPSTLLKKPGTHLHAERFIPGELTEEMWEEIVFSLRRMYESDTADLYGSVGNWGKGVGEQIGRSREWRFTSYSGVSTTVLFRPYKDGTRIELSQRVGLGSTMAESWGYGLFLSFFTTLIAFAISKSVVLGSAAFAASIALFVPLVYYLDTIWRAKKHRQLNETGDRLVALCAESTASTLAKEQKTVRKSKQKSAGAPATTETMVEPASTTVRMVLDDALDETDTPSPKTRTRS